MFSVEDGRILYALAALKNVGAEAMHLIVDARGAAPFVTLFDFARRVDLKRVGKRPLEMLARAGAFDVLDRNRHRVLRSLDALVGYSAAIHEQRASSQVSLFGEAGDDLPEPRLAEVEDWLPNERLTEEHSAIGFYLSGHPLDDYMSMLRRREVKTLAEVTELVKSGPRVVKMAGSVSGRQERKSARGNRFAFVQASDPTGSYEMTVFSDTLETARDFLEPGQNIVVTVEATAEAEQLKLLCKGARPVDAVSAGPKGSGGFRVFLNDARALPVMQSILTRTEAAGPVRLRGPIHVALMEASLPGEVELELGADLPVSPQVRQAMKAVAGVIDVEDLEGRIMA